MKLCAIFCVLFYLNSFVSAKPFDYGDEDELSLEPDDNTKKSDVIAPVIASKTDVVAPQTDLVVPKTDVVAPKINVDQSNVPDSNANANPTKTDSGDVKVSNDQPIAKNTENSDLKSLDEDDFSEFQNDDPAAGDAVKKEVPFKDDDLSVDLKDEDVIGQSQDTVDAVETGTDPKDAETTGNSASSLTFATVLLILSLMHSFV